MPVKNEAGPRNVEVTVKALRDEIARLRTDLKCKNRELIELLDPQASDLWDQLIVAALDAGLEREQLSKILSVSPSTIHRWEAGQNVPVPFAREGIKKRIIDALAGTFVPLRERLRRRG